MDRRKKISDSLIIIFLICESLLLTPRNSQASSLGFENTNSPTAWTSNLDLTADVNKNRPHRALKDINLQYGTGAEMPDSNATSGNWIVTNTLIGGLDWEFGPEKLWSSSLALTISNQPAELYSTQGLEFDLNRKFEFGKNKKSSGESVAAETEENKVDANDDDFIPSLKIGIKAGNSTLSQKAKVRKNSVLLTELTAPQLKTGVNIKYEITSWMSISSEYNGYTYTPVINTFETYLNTTQGAKLTGMSTAMGQLNIYEWTNKIMFDLSDDWEWDLSGESSEALVGGGMTWLYESNWYYKVSKSFEIDFGVGQIQPTTNLEGIFNLVYNY